MDAHSSSNYKIALTFISIIAFMMKITVLSQMIMLIFQSSLQRLTGGDLSVLVTDFINKDKSLNVIDTASLSEQLDIFKTKNSFLKSYSYSTFELGKVIKTIS